MPQVAPEAPEPTTSTAGTCAPVAPRSLLDFQRQFPSDRACAHYLECLRWPKGFTCPHCGVVGEPFRFEAKPTVLRCRSCREDTRLTAGTIMQDSKQPLLTWFWAAYLVTSETPGMSALQFQRQLGMKRYETAFMMLHKLRAGMVRPDRDPIGSDWPVEVDETLIGGKTKGEGKGVHHKLWVAGAVEVRTIREGETLLDPSGPPRKRGKYVGRIRLQVLFDRTGPQVEHFVTHNVARGARVGTDGFPGYSNLIKLGYSHEVNIAEEAADPNDDKWLPKVHLIFSNLKTWINGTHHGVSGKHLQAYLDEYVFRFNRRFYPMRSFHSALGIGTMLTAPTYEELYHGAYVLDWNVRENPVSAEAVPEEEMIAIFKKERATFARMFPEVKDVQFRIRGRHFLPKQMLTDRDLAWWQPEERVICLLRNAAFRSRATIRGLIRHELGHAADERVDDPGSEKRADRIAQQATGVPVRYTKDMVQSASHGEPKRPPGLHK